MKSVENVLRSLVSEPKFYGSLVGNNEAAYNAIEWVDERAKPTWSELEAASVNYEAEQVEIRIREEVDYITKVVIAGVAGSPTEQTNRLMLGLKTQNQLRKGQGNNQEHETAVDEIIAVGDKVELVLAKSQELIESYVALGEDLTEDDLAAIKVELVAAGDPVTP